MSVNPFEAPSWYGTEETLPPLTPSEILFSFRGRIPRSTWWLGSLGLGAAYFAMTLATTALFGEESLVGGLLVLVACVPMIWVSLALQVKRWHDRDHSGWMVLVGMIPIVGPIWTFVALGLMPGTPGRNTYGAEPL